MTTRTADPWAILPDQLASVLHLLEAPESALQALAPARHLPAHPAPPGGDVAQLRVIGPILRRPSFLSDLLNWPTTETLALDLRSALDNPSITRLVLEIDSPGGQAAGIGELAAMLRNSPKPVTAVVDNLAASAGYWLAAAAHELVISPSAMLGSVGVIATYRPEKDAPIRIVSSQSPLKRADPSTDEGRADAQRVVDQLADVFIGDVARYRRTAPATVSSTFGRGGLLVGAAALAAGMADRFGTLRDTLNPPSPPARKETAMSHPPTSAAARRDALIDARVREGLARPLAILEVARTHPDLIAAVADERAAAARPDPAVEATARARYERGLAIGQRYGAEFAGDRHG